MSEAELSDCSVYTLPSPVMIEDRDPLLGMIAAYRVGLADFQANAPEDDAGANAYAEISYGLPMANLENWNRGATTLKSAIAAVSLARDANRDGDRRLVGAMLFAALVYFQRQTLGAD
jgi:hypothetical protein